MTDEQLIALILGGDHNCLAILVERHYRPLLGYLYRMVSGNRQLAEDLVQETFVHVLKQDSYTPGRPFKPWLYAIATNLVCDHFRAADTRRKNLLDMEGMAQIYDPAPGPEELAFAAEQGRAVAGAL